MIKSRRIQIRVSDIYRYIVTGETREIEGITHYTASKTHIAVRFEGRVTYRRYVANTEKLRRQVVKDINKRLGENLHVTQ